MLSNALSANARSDTGKALRAVSWHNRTLHEQKEHESDTMTLLLRTCQNGSSSNMEDCVNYSSQRTSMQCEDLATHRTLLLLLLLLPMLANCYASSVYRMSAIFL